MKTITKTENVEGIESLDAIIGAADGIMMARGDMGVEVPAEKAPRIQKKIICKCNKACKTVITATQMLDSTIRDPRPTRAEMMNVVDTAYDDTDMMMFSGEMAMGRYPMGALKTMTSIVLETEMHPDCTRYRQRKATEQNMRSVSNTVCFVFVSTAHNLDADMIIAPSITGSIIQMLSKWGPGARIIDTSLSMATVRQMQLQQGAVPVWSHRAGSTDELIENSVGELRDRGLVEEGELAVIAAGVIACARRHEAVTQTNTIRVINIE